RADVLTLLLDEGFDPDETTRFPAGDGHALTRGMPLWHCASTGKHALAELLLTRGANPNAMVYASGTPVFQAYDKRDWRMVDLLARFGGEASATVAGLYRETEQARRILARDGAAAASELLWAAACGGDPETVAAALGHIDWPREDGRWFHALEQPLR
ncbi:MAG TPA: hypothetical protein DEH78_18955, partial [Solibacterales bacterium]|nr:hypothetical protein [Bryobacterales bacterium]